MIKHEKTEQVFNRLRKQAEDLIRLESEDIPVPPQSDIMELIHELHIHQVEIELQNEELKRAQSEISLLHEEYADLYEFAPSGYVTLNPKGIITHCNLASVMILGMDRTRLIGYGFSGFISLESKNDYYSALKRSEKNQDNKVATELKLIRPGGVPVWVCMDIQADVGDENQLIRKRLVFMNIDRQKKVEDQLTKREERLALAVRAARLGIWDWDIKKNEMVWDHGMYELYGLRQNTAPDIYEAWLNNLHPDDREETDRLCRKAMLGEKEYDTEFRILLPDGAIRYVKAMGRVTWDKEGLPERMTGVNYDITASKRVELELRENEEKYRVLFDTFPLGITISDSSGKILETNSTAQNLLGVPKKQHEMRHLSGKEWRIIRPDETIMPDHEFASVRALNEKRRIENVEMGIVKPGQDIAWLNVTAAPIKLENYGVVVTYADITERKKAEESVRRMETERRQNALELEDTNIALNVLLKKRERDNKEMKQKLYTNYESMIGPFLFKLRNSLSDSQQHRLLDILEKSLKDIFSPFIKKLADPLILLTPSEIQIATMVKQGLSSKEIAQTLECSIRTIETHRAHIRKKTDITNKKINLKSYFSTL